MGHRVIISKEKKGEYKEKMLKLIESLGEWNVSARELSDEWGVPSSTVQNWKMAIIKKRGIIDIEEVGRNISDAMVSNIKLCERLKLESTDKKTKLQAARTLAYTVEKFTNFLEAYGYKAKIPDEVNINQKTVQLNIEGIDLDWPMLKKGNTKDGSGNNEPRNKKDTVHPSK